MASCNGWDKLSGPPTLLEMVIHCYPACKVTVRSTRADCVPPVLQIRKPLKNSVTATAWCFPRRSQNQPSPPSSRAATVVLFRAHVDYKAVVMQIDSYIPSRLLFPNSFLLPGADTAVVVGANLPRNVKMPYAGATVTGLTNCFTRSRGPQSLAQPVTCCAPVFLHSLSLTALQSCQLLFGSTGLYPLNRPIPSRTTVVNSR